MYTHVDCGKRVPPIAHGGGDCVRCADTFCVCCDVVVVVLVFSSSPSARGGEGGV